MEDLYRLYASYNGVPLCKTFSGTVCIKIEPTTPEMIQGHNSVPVPCLGERCEICHPELKEAKG